MTDHPEKSNIPPASDGPYVLVGRSHVPPLDGIRGVAVGLVMLRHFLGQNWEPLPGTIDHYVYNIARLGSNGVDMFFVLSGFLITGILLDTKEKSGYFRNFYMRRTLRIFPLYYLALAIAFFLWPHLMGGHSSWVVARAGDHQAWFWLYAANLLFAVKQSYEGLAHFWSLAVEEQFYLVWPLLVFLLNRRQLLIACGLCFVISIATRVICGAFNLNTLVAYVLTPGRIDALAVGAGIATLARSPDGLQPYRKFAVPAVVAPLLLLVTLVALTFGQGRTHLVNILGGSLVAIFFSGILLATVTAPRSAMLPRIFCWKPLAVLGKYSYCLYVCHLFVQEAVERFWSKSWIPSVAGSQLLDRFVFVVVCSILSLTVSLLSWHLFEKHWLRLKRFFD